MVKIAPSVLSADFAHLKEDIDTIYDGGKSWIHYDVMDGHFVPNISFGYSILSNLRAVTDLFIDVHLMITDQGYCSCIKHAGITCTYSTYSLCRMSCINIY